MRNIRQSNRIRFAAKRNHNRLRRPVPGGGRSFHTMSSWLRALGVVVVATSSLSLSLSSPVLLLLARTLTVLLLVFWGNKEDFGDDDDEPDNLLCCVALSICDRVRDRSEGRNASKWKMHKIRMTIDSKIDCIVVMELYSDGILLAKDCTVIFSIDPTIKRVQYHSIYCPGQSEL